jgi:hypothetical protein
LRPRPALAGAKLSSLSLVVSSSSTKLTVTLERVLHTRRNKTVVSKLTSIKNNYSKTS